MTNQTALNYRIVSGSDRMLPLTHRFDDAALSFPNRWEYGHGQFTIINGATQRELSVASGRHRSRFCS